MTFDMVVPELVQRSASGFAGSCAERLHSYQFARRWPGGVQGFQKGERSHRPCGEGRVSAAAQKTDFLAHKFRADPGESIQHR